MNGSWYFYFRAYYAINRKTWPEMGRIAAARDASKLARQQSKP